MFAQANSEHCRHKIFNAEFVVDGERQPQSLFQMIRRSTEASPGGVLSAYKRQRRRDRRARRAAASSPIRRPASTARTREPMHILMKVETHNHPTAISPFPGAATGSGGEIRDEGATGRGAQPEGGADRLHGLEPAHARRARARGSATTASPTRIASALDIMIDGPLGGAAFNNEFGRPQPGGLLPHLRARGRADRPGGAVRGYHKPIMLAGGLGNVRAEHVQKGDDPGGRGARRARRAGDADRPRRRRGVVARVGRVARGPRFRLGAARQRRDAAALPGGDRSLLGARRRQPDPVDPRRRRRRPVERAARAGARQPAAARASSCARSRPTSPACRRSSSGATRRRSATCWRSPPSGWPTFAALCARERCPYAVVGRATDDGRLAGRRRACSATRPIDLPLERAARQAAADDRGASARRRGRGAPFSTAGARPRPRRSRRVLAPADGRRQDVPDHDRRSHASAASSRAIRWSGPWQVPVADAAVTADQLRRRRPARRWRWASARRSRCSTRPPRRGSRSARRSRTSPRAPIAQLGRRQAVGATGWPPPATPARTRASTTPCAPWASSSCPALGIAIPGRQGLDVDAHGVGRGGESRSVTAPLSLVVTAFAPVHRRARARSRPSCAPAATTARGELLLVDLGRGKNRLGGSALAQVYGQLGAAPPDLDDPALLGGLLRGDAGARRGEAASPPTTIAPTAACS